VKIKYLGHSSFFLTADNGIKIITDPYTPNERIKLAAPAETADIVTMSHSHGDHSNIMVVKGNPQGLMGYGKWNVKGIEIQGMATYHDDAGGKRAGSNMIYCFNIDGLKVCHCGDLGHLLSDAQFTELGKVDVLLIPTGGNYTIDAAAATAIMNRLKPLLTIPMHYRNPKVDYPVAGVEEFTKDKRNVVFSQNSELEVSKNKGAVAEIIVLAPAL
jgi:L-ascorbate metabolism protein UlaG (beta-lactamase superfamily)